MARNEVAVRRAGGLRRRLALSVAGILLGAGLYFGNEAFIQATNPASCAQGCVTNGSIAFDSDGPIVIAEHAIEEENARVTSDGQPYISVVLLDPFTYTASGDVSLDRMADELRGAQLAQLQANAGGHIGIQLLLANEGTTDEEWWSQVVQQIVSLKNTDNIVAVAGMGLSIANSQASATSLAAAGVPMFGAVTTGDIFNGNSLQGFYQLSPNVKDQVATLVSSLEQAKNLKQGQNVTLVVDDQASDLYTSDLQSDFTEALIRTEANLSTYQYTPHSAQTAVEFELITQNVCQQQGTSALVVYAGRVSTLNALIAEFQQSPECMNKTVIIVTGSDANSLAPTATFTPSARDGAKVSVEYADIENLSNLTPSFNTSYTQDLKTEDPTYSGRSDEWTIATYNSVVAATTAISAAYTTLNKHANSGQTVLPTATAVVGAMAGLQGPQAFTGATGSFGFSSNDNNGNAIGQLLSPEIPVYLDTDGEQTQISTAS
jgi:esterase/lipase